MCVDCTASHSGGKAKNPGGLGAAQVSDVSSSFFSSSPLLEIQHHRRAVVQTLVEPLVTSRSGTSSNAGARIHTAVNHISSYFSERHNLSMKMLSRQRPRPSMLIATPRLPERR